MVKTKHVKNILTVNGFVRTEKKLPHGYEYKHPDGHKTTVKEYRGDIPKGTLKAIERQSGLKFN